MPVSASDRTLYRANYFYPNMTNLLAAYAPSRGVKGGLRFLAVEREGTGEYSITPKNIYQQKYPGTDLHDGDTTFYTGCAKFVFASIVYDGSVSTNAATTFILGHFDPIPDGEFGCLTFKKDGTKTDPSYTPRLNVQFSFEKFGRLA